MFNLTRTFAMLSISLVIGCATSSSDETSSSGKVFDSPIGEWTEQYESSGGHEIPSGAASPTKTIKFTIIDETRGTAQDQRLEFYAIDEQGRWKGYWISEKSPTKYFICDEEKGGSPYWGEIIFRFNENYNQYTGAWDRCGEGKKFPIKGFR